MSCWMIPTSSPCFIILGRFGDIIQLLPSFMEIHRRSGHKPVVITSTEYGSIYDGVSYVQPYLLREHWWSGIPKAKRIAQELFGNGIVCQFWHEPPKHDDTIGHGGRNWTTLQSHGQSHGVNLDYDPDYGTSMARRCGFARDEWVNLPLVFDRRSAAREEMLLRNVRGTDPRPMLLFNFQGISSPFAFAPEILNPLMQRYGKHFKLVDLGQINAHRIYDMLVLYDHAAGLITSDTATAHLAPGSNIPWVMCHVDGWTQSVPKGNCQLSIGYNETPRRINDVMNVVEGWKQNAHIPSVQSLQPA